LKSGTANAALGLQHYSSLANFAEVVLIFALLIEYSTSSPLDKTLLVHISKIATAITILKLRLIQHLLQADPALRSKTAFHFGLSDVGISGKVCY